MNFFGYGEQDTILCEAPIHAEGCNMRAASVHHIDNRGRGGSKCKDYIENLAGLSIPCHEKAEHNAGFNDSVRINHLKNVIKRLEKPDEYFRP